MDEREKIVPIIRYNRRGYKGEKSGDITAQDPWSYRRRKIKEKSRQPRFSVEFADGNRVVKFLSDRVERVLTRDREELESQLLCT